jgi:hypothetical protein
MGPFATVEEKNVGPGMAFTMYRPMMLTQKHPVITWGNGTGASPQTYGVMLKLWASHGFIVIASNSQNVGQGSPPPMLEGVTWVLEQDMTAGVPLYQHVDRDRIGASGHSQGAFATTSAGSDPRIKTIAPIQTFGGGRGLHGPVLALCGGMDTLLGCDGNLSSWYARGTSRPYGRRIRDLRISRSIRDRCTSWGSPAAACRACTTEPLRDI